MVGSSSLPESSDKLYIDGSGCSDETYFHKTCSELSRDVWSVSNGCSKETDLCGDFDETMGETVHEGSSGHSDETVCDAELSETRLELSNVVLDGLWLTAPGRLRPTGLNG